MRILLDCTHTARYPFNNTGIQRVVRSLVPEFLDLLQTGHYPDLDLMIVAFNGKRVVQINPKIDLAYIPLSEQPKLSKIQIFTDKVIGKLTRIGGKLRKLPILKSIFPEQPPRFKIDGLPEAEFSPGDLYLIADASWEMPAPYLDFLKYLRLTYQVRVGVICYDLIPMKFPQLCAAKLSERFTEFYQTYAGLFDRVYCISQRIAQDYLDAQQQGLLPIAEGQQVKSFHLGCDYIPSQKTEASATELASLPIALPDRYFLVVGSIVPHKNPQAIVDAFEQLCKALPDQNIQLLFVGGRGWHPATNAYIEQHSYYGKSIHILSEVSDRQLKLLYQNCFCLIQASFYEGFGLPVVEALQYGKPVISSTGGSLPEVGQDFCLYFNPENSSELHELMKKLVTNSDYCQQLKARIQQDYQPFLWRDSAQELLNCLAQSHPKTT